MLASLSRRQQIIVGGSFALSIVTFVLHLAHTNEVLQFIVGACALGLLAAAVGESVEEMGSRLGAGATGVLQSALGNLPELFFAIFALRKGLVVVVQAALIGSLLANMLLVFGLALLFGGLKNGTQRFSGEAPRMISTLLLISMGALIMPTLVHQLHTPASSHESGLSVASAVVLLLVFAASIPYSLKGGASAVTAPAEETHDRHWPMKLAILVLGVTSVLSAFVSDFFVQALEPAIKSLGISQAFAGLVIVAIAGNAVENVVGIQLALKNRTDYALSVILNSPLQIALGLTPMLVLLSYVVGGAHLSLVMPPLLIVALALATVAVTVIVIDAETIWLEGVALIGLYVMIAAAFWWG